MNEERKVFCTPEFIEAWNKGVENVDRWVQLLETNINVLCEIVNGDYPEPLKRKTIEYLNNFPLAFENLW